MKQAASILAVALLIGGVSSASAIDSAASKQTVGATTSSSLNLTQDQKKTLWSDINSSSPMKQKTPESFNAVVGASLPSSITSNPLPGKAATDVPSAKPYNYVMMESKLLLVDPADKKIVEVIIQ